MSSSTSSVMKLAASWLVAAGIAVIGIRHMDEIRTAMGIGPEAVAAAAATPGDSPPAAARQAPDDEPPRSRTSRTVEISASGHGHYFAQAYINGRPVETMVDTGASLVAMPYEDARRAGIVIRESDYTHRVSTANGTARVAIVMLESVAIDDIVVRDVRAAVTEPGKLQTTLLGMSFLGRLARAEISRGVLRLEE